MPSNFQQRTPRRRFLPVPTFQTLVFHKTKKGYREFPASGPRPFYRAAWSAATSGLPAELGREPKQPVLGQLARWQRCSVSNKRPRRRFVLGTKMRRRLTGLAWPVRPAEQANELQTTAVPETSPGLRMNPAADRISPVPYANSPRSKHRPNQPRGWLSQQCVRRLAQFQQPGETVNRILLEVPMKRPRRCLIRVEPVPKQLGGEVVIALWVLSRGRWGFHAEN
jgi:hypothetical protein